MSPSKCRQPMRRVLGLFAAALMILAVNARPASAHTGFESSAPADGETVEEPVSEIVVTFTGPATPAGDGFVVLDPSGALREPDNVNSVDDLTWTLTFAEPLAGGLVGVRWKVAAPDAHPIDGSFSFTVAVPTTTTTTPPPPPRRRRPPHQATSPATNPLRAKRPAQRHP